MSRPLRVAALVKQIPQLETLALGPDGRLLREGLELHMNDYCRRAVAKGYELATKTDGTLTVITLGPPAAETVLREAIAFGADEGVLVTDQAFAGSDTWATAKALAAALRVLAPFDLVLMGRNSLDADTGQVPPQLAAFLDLPLCTGVRDLDLDGDSLQLALEHDDERVRAAVELPAVLSCAERLCDPCKIKDPAVWATVDGSRIRRLSAADLGEGEGPWGQAASPTRVGEVRPIEATRAQVMAEGSIDEQAAQVVTAIAARGGLVPSGADDELSAAVVDNNAGLGGPAVVVAVEPHRSRVTRELLGAAAQLASEIGGHAVALAPDDDVGLLSTWGADAVVATGSAVVPEDIAGVLSRWSARRVPWAILGPGTEWGREVLARASAVLQAGMTGDAVALEVRDGRLVAWKPAFGGELVAEILCDSPIQMASVRPGVLRLRRPRAARPVTVTPFDGVTASRVSVLERVREDDSDELANATVVIGVGVGVDPDDYPLVRAFAERIGGVLAATRKVTDRGWMPRARQVGVTGHSIAPRLFISIGASGKFNHTVGVRSAGTVVAVNIDPTAPIFGAADIGVVGDWRDVLAALVPRLEQARTGHASTADVA